MREKDAKEKSSASDEYEKQFGCILHSTVHSETQKAAAIVALKKARTSPLRCEVLLQLLICAKAGDIIASVEKRGISRNMTPNDKKKFLRAIASSSLSDERKSLSSQLVESASTKQELVII